MNLSEHRAYEESLRRYSRLGLFALAGRELDLTDSQLRQAKSAYEAVGDWLASSADPYLQDAKIYPHGSTAIGTATKPWRGNEFDVDLICHLPNAPSNIAARYLKETVGKRLREHDLYAKMLVEKKRCWRIEYAGEYHLDATPSVPNPRCSNRGELVPDRELNELKATNPRAYAELFLRRATLLPTMRLTEAQMAAKAEVAPFPVVGGVPKLLLQLITQLLKRHRDVHFDGHDNEDFKPISIIITTLAMRAYESCIQSKVFNDELELFLAVIEMLPAFIEEHWVHDKRLWVVQNETTQGENFADRWSEDSRWATSFYSWHEAAVREITAIANEDGQDRLVESLSRTFFVPRAPLNERMQITMHRLSEARKSSSVRIAVGAGLALTATQGATVRGNTFFGDR